MAEESNAEDIDFCVNTLGETKILHDGQDVTRESVRQMLNYVLTQAVERGWQIHSARFDLTTSVGLLHVKVKIRDGRVTEFGIYRM